MSITTQASLPVSPTIAGATNPRITNLTLVAGVENSHALVNGLKGLLVRNRNYTDTKLAFVVGETASKYVTIPKGASIAFSDLTFSGQVLYLNATHDSTAEIVETY